MGLFEDFWEEVYHGIIEKIISTDEAKKLGEIWDSIDIFKLGSPISRGEQYYINDFVKDHHFPRESGDTLADIYHNALKYEVKWSRRGWMAEYIGDTFCQNPAERFLFLVDARLGLITDSLHSGIDAIAGEPGEPHRIDQKLFWSPFFWAPMFFYWGTAVFGALVTQGVFVLLDWAFMPTLFLFYLSYSKWYGKYGCYLPIIKTQTLISALGTVFMYLMIIRVSYDVVFRWFAGIPFIGPIIQNFFTNPELVTPVTKIPILGLLVGWIPIVNQMVLPNPIYFGMGPFVASLSWANVLLVLGLAGAVNWYYGEYIEYHKELEDEIEKMIAASRSPA